MGNCLDCEKENNICDTGIRSQSVKILKESVRSVPISNYEIDDEGKQSCDV